MIRAWQNRWQALRPREQLALRILLALLVVLALWSLRVRPALETLSQSPSLRSQAQQQWAQMQALHSQAQSLQKAPLALVQQPSQRLQQLTRQAGADWQIQIQGEQADLQVQNASAAALSQWLAQAREQALALPIEAELTRAGTPEDRWSGRIRVQWPRPGAQP